MVKRDQIIWFAEGVTCGNVSITNLHCDEDALTEAPTIQIDKNVKIEKLVLSNVDQRFKNCIEVPLIVNNGQLEKLIQ